MFAKTFFWHMAETKNMFPSAAIPFWEQNSIMWLWGTFTNRRYWKKDRAVYAGSLEPLDKNETGPHGYMKGELTSQGTSITFVPCSHREYKRIKIQVKEQTTQFSLEDTLKKPYRNGSAALVLRDFRRKQGFWNGISSGQAVSVGKCAGNSG